MDKQKKKVVVLDVATSGRRKMRSFKIQRPERRVGKDVEGEGSSNPRGNHNTKGCGP